MESLVRHPSKHKKCKVVHSWFYDNVYNFNFYVAYGGLDELREYCKMEHDYETNDSYFCGRSIMMEHGSKVIMLFNSAAIRQVSAYRYADIVVHECYHAVDHVFDLLRVGHHAEGDNEAWAYYLGFVTRNTVEFLNDSIRAYKRAFKRKFKKEDVVI